ncbi:hypothetical protein [Mesorhizobium sp. A623]
MVSTGTDIRAANGSGEIDAELCALLSESLTALTKAGQADAACRLAGRACALLRGRNSPEWARFNKLLHRLSPMTGDISTQPPAGNADDSHKAEPASGDAMTRFPDG